MIQVTYTRADLPTVYTMTLPDGAPQEDIDAALVVLARDANAVAAEEPKETLATTIKQNGRVKRNA